MNKSCGVTSTKTDIVTINTKTKEPTIAAIFARLRSNRNRMNTGTRRIPTATDDATIFANISRPEDE
jgi:hypothetical protein